MAELIYYGVSAVQLTTHGKKVVIDPYLRKSPIKPVDPHDVEADIILVTHGARDHMGDAIELALISGAYLVAGIDVLTCARKKGVPEEKTLSMVPGAERIVEGVPIKALHVQHISFTRCDDTVYTGTAMSYLITMDDGGKFYHAGDSALHGDFKLFGEIYKPDIALMPIGMFKGAKLTEMQPWEAAIATSWLNVSLAIPVHYDLEDQADYPNQFRNAVHSHNDNIDVSVTEVGIPYLLQRGTDGLYHLAKK